jgi:hypothetical protein
LGNIFAAGYISGIMIIGDDTLESTGRADFVVMKLGPACNLLWVKHIPATEEKTLVPDAIALDNSGRLHFPGLLFYQPFQQGMIALPGHQMH